MIRKMKNVKLLFIILLVILVFGYIMLVIATEPTITEVILDSPYFGKNITCNASVGENNVPFYKWYINNAEFEGYKKFLGYNGLLNDTIKINATPKGNIFYLRLLPTSNITYITLDLEPDTAEVHNISIYINTTLIFDNRDVVITKNTTANFSGHAQDFLRGTNCIYPLWQSKDGYCFVPFNITSNSSIMVKLSNLNLSVNQLYWGEFKTNQNITCEVSPFNYSDFGNAMNATAYIQPYGIYALFTPLGENPIPINVTQPQTISTSVYFVDPTKNNIMVDASINGLYESANNPIIKISNLQNVPFWIVINVTNTSLPNVDIYYFNAYDNSTATKLDNGYNFVKLSLNEEKNLFLWANYSDQIDEVTLNLTFRLFPEICAMSPGLSTFADPTYDSGGGTSLCDVSDIFGLGNGEVYVTLKNNLGYTINTVWLRASSCTSGTSEASINGGQSFVLTATGCTVYYGEQYTGQFNVTYSNANSGIVHKSVGLISTITQNVII